MNINNQKFPIAGHDLFCFRDNRTAYRIKRFFANRIKKELKNSENENEAMDDAVYNTFLHRELIKAFELVRNNSFDVESDIPHPTPVYSDLYIPELYSQIIDILSDINILNKECIFVSKDPCIKIKSGSKIISKEAKVRFIFPVKLLIKVLMELFSSEETQNKKRRNDSLLRFDFIQNDPLKNLPYYIMFFLRRTIKTIILPDNLQDTRKFYLFNEQEIKVNLESSCFIDKKLTEKELKECELSMETAVILEYTKKDNTLNIKFDDELIIDFWLGKESLFFTAENYRIFCGTLIEGVESLLSVEKKTKSKRFISRDLRKFNFRLLHCFYNVLPEVSSVDKTQYSTNATEEVFDNEIKAIFDNFKFYSNSTNLITSERFTSSLDFIYSIKSNNSLSSFLSEKFSKINNRIIKKGIMLLPQLISKYYDQESITSIGIKSIKLQEYVPVLNKVFNLIRDIKTIDNITSLGCRPLLFSFLGTFQNELLHQGEPLSSIFIIEVIQSFKINLIYLDKIKAEQKKKEDEAKLLVRNLRHSINNTSEAVLANLKEAIEIINQQSENKNNDTVNHLYSCSDEVRVLRNTVLKFCHEIIDTDTLGELYRESFADVKADERISIKEILYSSLFMSVKQIIQNIRLKDLKANYRKAKTLEIPYNDNLFNKFKDYIGIKYDQDFSELTESEMKEDITLYKDYQNYIYTATQSADFDKLYEDFVQKNNMKAVLSFMEKYFFSKIEIIWDKDDVYLRRASYASYLFTDLLNEIFLNATKYTLPDSALKIRIEGSNCQIKMECNNITNAALKQKYGSGMGIIGQQKVVEKVGGNLQTTENKSGEFSLKFELPIY